MHFIKKWLVITRQHSEQLIYCNCKFDQAVPETWRIISQSAAKTDNYLPAYDLAKKYIEKGDNYNVDLIETYINSAIQLEGPEVDDAITFLETTSFNWKEVSILSGLAAGLYQLKGDLEKARRIFRKSTPPRTS